MSDWFGFRIVRVSGVGHGFRRPHGRSLCGRVTFGPEPRYHARYRPCKTCAQAWAREHPPGWASRS